MSVAVQARVLVQIQSEPMTLTQNRLALGFPQGIDIVGPNEPRVLASPLSGDSRVSKTHQGSMLAGKTRKQSSLKANTTQFQFLVAVINYMHLLYRPLRILENPLWQRYEPHTRQGLILQIFLNNMKVYSEAHGKPTGLSLQESPRGRAPADALRQRHRGLRAQALRRDRA